MRPKRNINFFHPVRIAAHPVPLLLGLAILFCGSTCSADEVAAYDHLTVVMDQFNRTFNVFTDLGAAGNHFAALCGMGENNETAGISLDESSTDGCQDGATCIKNSFFPVDKTYWGGWYFDNGVLQARETQPQCNWGQFAKDGFDLSGAGPVTFWARGQLGGERIDFFVGGIGRDAMTGRRKEPHPDSFARTPPFGHTFKLTSNWRKYTINLGGRNLRYVVGGFAWVASAAWDPKGATFYLDDIRYTQSRLKALRFLVSYSTFPVPGNTFDYILQNVAFTYDNSVTLLALLAQGTKHARRRARRLADVSYTLNSTIGSTMTDGCAMRIKAETKYRRQAGRRMAYPAPPGCPGGGISRNRNG